MGQYGTAAERAKKNQPPAVGGRSSAAAADSGYLATTADVGFVGLAILLAIFGRMIVLLRRGTARGEDAAWFGIAIIVVFLVDAALRSSLTGFPTAHLAMLLIGLSLAATKVSDPTSPRTSRRPGRHDVSTFGELEILIRDSAHTEASMRFEFETAWPALRQGAHSPRDWSASS